MKNIKVSSYASKEEASQREELFKLFRQCPIPDNEILSNLGLFLKRQSLTRILFMNSLYKIALDTHGIVIEFGVRWGQNLALFESFRGMYEPYNHNRKIVGFDTFEGFPSIDEKDGQADECKVGAFSVTEGYEEYLEQILNYHEQESPISHIKKFQLVKGDAAVEIVRYLNDNPETVIALAYFDLDLYTPTKKCLEAIIPHLTKGSVVGFDELNAHAFPGETLALKEALGLDKYKIVQSPYISGACSYIVID